MGGVKKIRPTLKFMTSRNDLEALMVGYRAAVEQLPAFMTDEHEEHDALLLQHAIEMRDMLEQLYAGRQQTFTLTLRQSDAVAIHQLWRSPFSIPEYSNVAVRRLYTVIEREHIPIPKRKR